MDGTVGGHIETMTRLARQEGLRRRRRRHHAILLLVAVCVTIGLVIGTLFL
jgi:hypothetical protein